MRILIGLFVALACFAVLACNPFGPTDYELAHSVTVSPSSITLHLGQQQNFTIRSTHGRLDEMWFGISWVSIEDPVCRCDKFIQFGSLERSTPSQLIYRAPLDAGGISLPTTIKLYVGSGEEGTIYSNFKYIAEIIINP